MKRLCQEDLRVERDCTVLRMNDTHKNGPINFYPTNERDAAIANVVEYCVQIGERQPLLRSQAAWLVVSGQVQLDGQPATKLGEEVSLGARQVTIRGRNHHVVVHPAMKE